MTRMPPQQLSKVRQGSGAVRALTGFPKKAWVFEGFSGVDWLSWFSSQGLLGFLGLFGVDMVEVRVEPTCVRHLKVKLVRLKVEAYVGPKF